MATLIDRSEIKDAYEDVRSDSTPTDWWVKWLKILLLLRALPQIGQIWAAERT